MASDTPVELARIVSNPDILVGKPTVRGTRISVQVVLEYLAGNMSFEKLFVDYPRLSIEDVRACLLYAGERMGSPRSRESADEAAVHPSRR